ncbi:MAG: hypothetical protein DHS20C01_15270 [marine bacterium B5-7]|nr:MAG: hypothetical protein DHS20C01_15270 [marine bacterium B5-7]
MATMTSADGAGGNSSYESDKLDAAFDYIQANDWPAAVDELNQQLEEYPDDADILNLLGFTHRKQGKYGEALDYYQRALAINPKHRGALEYLGELYLETDQLPLAEEQLAKLNHLCMFCSERRDLKKAISKYLDAQSS